MNNSYEKHRLNILAKYAGTKSVLDIGCAQQPNIYLSGENVVGLDLEKMEVSKPYTEHIVADAGQIDNVLAGRKFDSILMGEFIEHVECPYDILRSVKKFIKPGGSLILSTPNPLGFPVVIAEYLTLRKVFYTKHHVFYFTPRWVWRLLERSGYKIKKTIGCGLSLGKFRLPAPASLSYIVIYIAEPISSDNENTTLG